MTTGICTHVIHVHMYMPSGCVPCLPLENLGGGGFKEQCHKDILPVKISTAATVIGRAFPSGIRTLPGPTEGKWRTDVMSRYDRFGTMGSIKAGGWSLPCWVMPAILSHQFHSVGQPPAVNTLRNNCSCIQSVCEYRQRLCVNTT